jgi:hypothetical protein
VGLPGCPTGGRQGCGFRTFPYAVSRYVTRPGQVYGDSPGMLALADTKMLNVMAQTMIQEAQLVDFAAAAGAE